MRTYPWDILGIEPTDDEAAIHRAYARMLRKCRPDEDPEGFTRLVAARKAALDLRPTINTGEMPQAGSETNAPSQQNRPQTSQTSSSPHPPAPASCGDEDDEESGLPPQQSEAETPPRSSRDPGDTTPSPATHSDAQAKGRAFAAIINRLLHELHRLHPNWNGSSWRAALGQIGELDLQQRQFLREFIVREALPLLPPMQSVSAATAGAHNNQSPGQVAAIWEEEFSIAQNQSELGRLCGASAMLNYLAWLDCHRRLTIILEEENRDHARALACTKAIARLRELLRGSNSGPLWDAEQWQRILLPLADFPLKHRYTVRGFLIREALPLLPNLASIRTATSDIRERRGPGAVVALWEDQFSIAQDHLLFAPTTGAQNMSRYLRWASLAALACPPDQRSQAEHHFQAGLDQLLPPMRSAAETAKNEAWDPARWEAIFGQLRPMPFAEGARCRDLLAERLTLWLPDRPKERLRKFTGNAPAKIIEQLEGEFAVSDSFDAPSANADGLSRYQDWLGFARNRRSRAAKRERILLILAIATAMAIGYYATSLLK